VRAHARGDLLAVHFPRAAQLGMWTEKSESKRERARERALFRTFYDGGETWEVIGGGLGLAAVGRVWGLGVRA